MAEPAKEFIPSPRTKDCSKKPGGWGVPMADYEYIWFSNKGEDDYPEEACRPFYHKSAQIDDFRVNTTITGACDITITGEVTAPKFNGVAMLGGVTMNGETLYSQAIEEQNKLEEQIQLAFELPVNYMIG